MCLAVETVTPSMTHKLSRGHTAKELSELVAKWNIATLIVVSIVISIGLVISGFLQSVPSVIFGCVVVSMMHIISFLLDRYLLSRGHLVGMLAVCGYVVKIGVIGLAYVVSVKVSILDLRIVMLALVFGIIAGLITGTSVILRDGGPPIGE